MAFDLHWKKAVVVVMKSLIGACNVFFLCDKPSPVRKSSFPANHFFKLVRKSNEVSVGKECVCGADCKNMRFVKKILAGM